jgi:TPR repeat protein
VFSGINTEDSRESQSVPQAIKQHETKNAPSSPEDFKGWLATYKGVSDAEKNIVYGMMENNNSKADQYFEKACIKGDDRGCFQLGLREISESDTSGLDRLHDLAINSKNNEIALKSAQFIGAYILDFAPNNRRAVSESVEAVLPHAVAGDANSQFIVANLFMREGIYSDADDMLTKACTNPNASENIMEYCRSGQDVEMVDGSGNAIASAQKETGSCGKL